MRNATETARMHSLRRAGIGASGQAIYARRSRERTSRLRVIQEGDKLPGWAEAGFGTPETETSFLDGLVKSAREKASALLSNLKR